MRGSPLQSRGWQADVVERLIDGGIMEGLKAMSVVLNEPAAKAESLIALCNVSRCVGKRDAIVEAGIVQVAAFPPLHA